MAAIAFIVSDVAKPARVPSAVERSKLRTTAAALNFVPSWNVTPWRNVSVSSVRSGLYFQ